MSNPFFSLAKSRRTEPIDYRVGNTEIRVEAVADHGMATVWDADILVWTITHLVEAQNNGLSPSRHLVSTPYEILSFLNRGTGLRDYQRLKAALDRLQSTTIMTSIRQLNNRRRHRFSWVNEWREKTDLTGRPQGLEVVLADWLYCGALDPTQTLVLDPEYFELTGGFERWLYLLVRKHGGRQKNGWSFDFAHLHAKSGTLSSVRRFSSELRKIIARQPFSEYVLSLEFDRWSKPHLAFEYRPKSACGKAVNPLMLSGTEGHVLSSTQGSCYQVQKHHLSNCKQYRNRALNLYSNKNTNSIVTSPFGENPISEALSGEQNQHQATALSDLFDLLDRSKS